jgi:hypothetical protein
VVDRDGFREEGLDCWGVLLGRADTSIMEEEEVGLSESE